LDLKCVLQTKTTTEIKINQWKSSNLYVLKKEGLIMILLSAQSRHLGLAMMGLLITLNSCNFAQSVEKDLVTGLSTRGDGLSCEDVYLSDGEKVIKRNTFIYGESFYVNFDGMGGFERVGESAFPEMEIVVVDDMGDTALHIIDTYEGYKDGIEISPLVLHAQITVADPIHTDGDYTLHVNIQDRKGEGSFRAKLEFDVLPDEKIKLSGEQVTAREIYLFSQQRGQTIIDGRAAFNEDIYLLFEGLEGFSVDAGQVLLGLSMVVKDADGNEILDEADLFGDSGLKYMDVHSQVAPNFILTGSEVANPVSCVIRIWDKRSSAWISAYTEIIFN
jgi:hypothetical protein